MDVHDVYVAILVRGGETKTPANGDGRIQLLSLGAAT